MKLLKAVFMFSMLVSTAAGAADLGPGVPDFSKWGQKTLKDHGIADGHVVETKYPESFTYCRTGNATLWRYDVMRKDQLQALAQGKIAPPVTDEERRVVVDRNSSACAS